MCTFCDSTNINTIIEFVPKMFLAYNSLQFWDTCGKRKNVNVVLDVTP